MRRYVVHPGYVRSRSDGDLHYITYMRLINLFKVDPKLCVRFIEELHRPQPLDTHLYPKYSGDYTLP